MSALRRIFLTSSWLLTAFGPAPQNPAPPPHSQGAPAVGWLSVEGAHLMVDGQPKVLYGVSTHGLQWFGYFANASSIAWLQRDWGISVIRAAMYTAPEDGGYIRNRGLSGKVDEIIDAAIKSGIYVIVDWHILRDGNPRWYQREAIEFFTSMAQRYGNVPNVIYEICNEPNGNVSWTGDIKPYAEAVIAAIRKAAPRSIVIVGTPTWSQDVDTAAQAPLSATNVMYSLHFYTATHRQWLRDRVNAALAKNLPIFVTEWGMSEASGTGAIDYNETKLWLDFLAAHGISRATWSLTDDGETSALLRGGASPYGGWSDQMLSETGRYVKYSIPRPSGQATSSQKGAAPDDGDDDNVDDSADDNSDGYSD